MSDDGSENATEDHRLILFIDARDIVPTRHTASSILCGDHVESAEKFHYERASGDERLQRRIT